MNVYVSFKYTLVLEAFSWFCTWLNHLVKFVHEKSMCILPIIQPYKQLPRMMLHVYTMVIVFLTVLYYTGIHVYTRSTEYSPTDHT